jgi:signal transduction histidine kinase
VAGNGGPVDPTSAPSGQRLPGEAVGPFERVPAAAREAAVLAALAGSALLAFAIDPARSFSVEGVVLSLAPLLVIPWRHEAPIATFVAVELLIVGARAEFGANGPTDLIALVALFAVASHCRARWAWAAVALDVVLLGLSTSFGSSIPDGELAGEIVGQVVVAVLVVLGGLYLRARRDHLEALAERADRLARTHELEARAAVEEERRRIARELHDVVAHHVSVMTLHAGALERRLRTVEVPPELVDAATEVRVTGQEAMQELRHLLGLLRTDDASDDRGPQPDLGHLEDLVERVRETGMPVTLDVTGAVDRVSAGLALSLYRITQEALTNTLRHAGPVPAEVTVDVGERRVELEVRDHGLPAAPPSYEPREPVSGHGLAGIRERVALYDGEVVASAHPDGGFVIRAVIPMPR